MRIAVLSDPGNFHTQKWSLALKQAGADVTIFSFWESDFDAVPQVKIKPAYTVGGKITYASYLYSGKKLAKALSDHKIELINPINITPFGVWANRSGFRPMVSIAMGADILEYPPDTLQNDLDTGRIWASNSTEVSRFGQIVYSAKWRIFRKQVQEALDASDLITGDNLQLVYAVRNWFEQPEKKVRLNRWGVEEELIGATEAEQKDLREKYGIRDWQKVVVSPRGMKPVYQADVILNAFEKLLRRGTRDVKMIMLSAGYDIPPALDMRAMKLHDQFETFHYERNLLPREEVLKLWSVADAMISAPVYDGYSNALGEARYAGVIPIVNPIPANLELIDHQENGWVVNPFDASELADAILAVME
ncbi:MAG: glycosyltransferase [Bacteroidota bacterium]